MTYYLYDMTMHPPLLIDSGTYDDMQELLDELATIDGYGGYKILTKEDVAKGV